MLDAADSPETVALAQHRHGIHQHVPLCAQRVKEGPFVSAKRMGASCAVITPFNTAIDFDVAGTDFANIWTKSLIAPLSMSFHNASPRFKRYAKHNPKTGFPGLGVQHRKLSTTWNASRRSDSTVWIALRFREGMG